MAKSIEQVRYEFGKQGLSFSDWSKENNFSKDLVYRVLNAHRLPIRGESHKIAVKLGLKDD